MLISSNQNHKNLLVIDYSQTINKYTLLDEYPIPKIEDIVNQVAKYKIFSTIDLRSAYHQIPIKEDEKIYSTFEACGNLYQFRRIPFVVTIGVACFQRTIDRLINHEKLKDAFAYLDDVTICGSNQDQHDLNLKRFMDVAKKYNLTLNNEKCKISINSIDLLGYTIKNNVIKPDSERLKPLLEMQLPNNMKSLRRVMGMFAHYSKWIPNFSDKIQPLVRCHNFPMKSDEIHAFDLIKKAIVESVIVAIDENAKFTVETDASEFAIAAHLSQLGKPVAFYSRTLSKSEQRHSSVEKEAYAIVEALRKWRY